MSIIGQAEIELKAAGWGVEETNVMIGILRDFFREWDSGGAVAVAAPALQRLIAGQPLTPLTGADDEWAEVGTGIFQNKRLSSVFKDLRYHDGKLAYDIDAPEPRAAISFPYWPPAKNPRMPIFEI